MAKLTLNSISESVFRVNASDVADRTNDRAEIVSKGRMLAYAHAQRGKSAIDKALGKVVGNSDVKLTSSQYNQLNEQFQSEHLLYAANKACDLVGVAKPVDYADFKRKALSFYGNASFYAILQGIYQEIITPILPAIYSEAVDVFANVVEVGFGETYTISVSSNDIPVFQDSSWGASRSVPRNTFYSKDYTLNPQPKTCEIYVKYMQLIGTGMDFGKFFANLAAGMYAKTMGMWNSALATAIADTSLLPADLNYTFSNENWVSGANKISALNSTPISNLFATGNVVGLSQVLPTQVTGSTNVNMDAAIATLLGADYTRSGYLGEFMGVRLMPLVDAIVPGTQNTNPTTMLDSTKVYMMAGNGLKPMTIAYNSDTPLILEFTPDRTSDFTIGMNMTIALDTVATFTSKIAVFTV